MYHQMRWDPKDPWNPAADRLVLSEGHAVPIIYAAMADLGVAIGKSKADAAADDAGGCDGASGDRSPDRRPSESAGSAFTSSTRRPARSGRAYRWRRGLAAAAKMDGIDRNIYCIIGDGESREGQIWEAVDFIVDHALTNVVPIFNCNELAQSDWVSPQQSYQGAGRRRREAFGFIVRVIDGHDPETSRKALERAARRQERQPPAGDRRADGEGLGRAGRAGHGQARHAGEEGQAGERPRRAGSDGQGSGRRRTTRSDGELKITAADSATADRPVDGQADQDHIVRGRRSRGRAADKDLQRGQADRAAQSVRRGAAGAGRGRQARGRARCRREELDPRRVVRQEVPGAVPRMQDRRAEHDQRGGGRGRGGEDPVLLDLRQVRRAGVRPDRDGDHQRRELQDHRHATPA